jgi:hypothetical protein
MGKQVQSMGYDKQLNIYDTAENGLKLIPMHKTYSKLRPGTLVLAICNAHMYNMVQNGNLTSVRSRQHQQKPHWQNLFRLSNLVYKS